MKNTMQFTAKLLGAAITLATITTRLSSAESAGQDYLAHEWGTFTSVQGADGVQMNWNPWTVWDLPGFVYDRNRPDGRTNLAGLTRTLLTKGNTLARQRMETPVIYFYGDRAMNVDVEVGFPEGTITEWYPQATAFGPGLDASKEGPSKDSKRSFLSWNQVRVRSAGTRDTDLATLPREDSPNHYYAARATDANILQVQGTGPTGPIDEHEGFLFYRGVGEFQAPLTISITPQEKHVWLSNTGKAPLTRLFMVEIRQKQGRFLALGDLKTGQRTSAALAESDMMPVLEMQVQLGPQIVDALVSAGLYKKEALAMVETWRDSWLGEDGLRVLYLLPREWTDATLPLNLDPAPKDLVRVMVGRAEILTPSMEWEFIRQAVRYSDASDNRERTQAIQAVRALGLGRFAQPLSQRILGSHPSQEFSKSATTLLQLANAAADPTADPSDQLLKFTNR